MTSDPAESTTVAQQNPEAEQLYFQLMVAPPEDPFPVYRRLRETAPALLTSDGSALVLSRHQDCDAALRHRSFGKGDEWLRLHVKDIPEQELRPVMERMQRSMILTNPPDHTRLRRVVSSAFTARHVEALSPSILRWTDELLDRLAAEPGGDFMTTFAMPLPVNVISDLLGIPEEDRAGIAPAIHDMGLLIEPAAGPEEIVIGARAENSLAGYFAELLAAKRKNPGDDMLSRLTVSEGENLDETEAIATAILLFAGGNKPTANMLGNGLNALLNTPGELERLRADRSLIRSAVEEMLRYDAPAHVDVISVLEPVTFLGFELTPGQTVISMLGSANRDPEAFADPDTFDVGRRENPHLSFAAGLHYCLGGPLARLEGEIFLHRLLDRFGKVAVGEPKRNPGLGHHGFESLPVTLRA
ncbi:cytochrome P450 [Kitasatospora sp. NPDC056531]|uniref:cytochrome P450 n=1 Tax=Kitasatospora sp. NPDC056531 TaxID=3345856 RepID=UPI00367FDA7C